MFDTAQRLPKTTGTLAAFVALAGFALAQTGTAPPPGDSEYVKGTPFTNQHASPGLKVRDLGTSSHTYFVTMARGDDIGSGMMEFAEKYHITNAMFTAVGAIDQGVLGWSDPEKHMFHKIPITSESEIVSLTGNITPSAEGGRPQFHIHMVVCGPDGTPKAGHLIQGKVSLTLQAMVTSFEAVPAK